MKSNGQFRFSMKNELTNIIGQRRSTTANTGLAKVAVQCSADTFVVTQSWFSASTFVMKIATFAKPETVTVKCKKTEAADNLLLKDR